MYDPRLTRSNKDNKEHMLLAYVANLELEVDRLRKQSQIVQQVAWGALKRIQPLCAGQGIEPRQSLAEIEHAAVTLAEALRDLREPPGYHPAHDQVVAVAIRPLIEHVFRWQQRLYEAPEVMLRLELESEYMEWFPARLRHILDNLIANALRYRDSNKGEMRVTVGLRVSMNGYELRVSDNGVGSPQSEGGDALELFYRSSAGRAAGMGVGLAVARLLVEQSGGSLARDSNASEGQGTTFAVILPRYDVDDFLT